MLLEQVCERAVPLLRAVVIWELAGGMEKSTYRELSTTVDGSEGCRSQNLLLMGLEVVFCCVKPK